MLAELAAAAKVAETVEHVVGVLNGARTVLLEVQNHTDFSLRVTGHRHHHGDFKEPPDPVVPPRNDSIFGSGSKSWSVGTGTEGWVEYSIEGLLDTTFSVRWNNPFAGGNDCSARLNGEKSAAFEKIALCGGGNDAHMKYELRTVRDPGLARWPDYRWVRLEGYALDPMPPQDPDSPDTSYPAPVIDLWSFYSPGRNDNFATTNPDLTRLSRLEDPDYSRFRFEGYIFRPDRPQPGGTVRLHSWWSPSRADNHATADPTLTSPLRSDLDPDYRHYRHEGYLYSPEGQPPPNTSPVHSWYSPRRGDNFLTTDPTWHPG